MKSEKGKLHSGEIYAPMGDEIMTEQLRCLDKLYDFNATRPTELKKRGELLQEMFAEIGEKDREYYFRSRRIPEELKK